MSPRYRCGDASQGTDHRASAQDKSRSTLDNCDPRKLSVPRAEPGGTDATTLAAPPTNSSGAQPKPSAPR
jgi:hypothetical protein